ncbi:MAG TPA: hypothetical protein VKG78_01400 [Opitutaceae bacterium]|nr:hypothetical protein [Opitutaceae bacterium]
MTPFGESDSGGTGELLASGALVAVWAILFANALRRWRAAR